MKLLNVYFFNNENDYYLKRRFSIPNGCVLVVVGLVGFDGDA